MHPIRPTSPPNISKLLEQCADQGEAHKFLSPGAPAEAKYEIFKHWLDDTYTLSPQIREACIQAYCRKAGL